MEKTALDDGPRPTFDDEEVKEGDVMPGRESMPGHFQFRTRVGLLISRSRTES